MAGLSFLAKKSWHTSNLSNQEKVWVAEQKAAAEETKTRELQAQIKLEREREEFQKLAAQAKGGSGVVGDRGTNWMYEGGGAASAGPGENDANTANASVEEAKNEAYLMGKEYVPEGQAKHAGDFAMASEMTGALEKASTYGANIGIGGAGGSEVGGLIGGSNKQADANAAETVLRIQDTHEAVPFEDENNKTNEWNQNFHLRHEDPMFAVQQKRTSQQKEVEKKRKLLERAGLVMEVRTSVVDTKGNANAKGSIMDDRDGHRKKKSRKHSSKSRKSKRRHRSKSKRRHRDRSPSYSSYSSGSSYGSGRRHHSKRSSRGDRDDRHTNQEKIGDHHARHRERKAGHSRSRSRSRSVEKYSQAKRRGDDDKHNEHRDEHRRERDHTRHSKGHRHRRSRSRSRSYSPRRSHGHGNRRSRSRSRSREDDRPNGNHHSSRRKEHTGHHEDERARGRTHDKNQSAASPPSDNIEKNKNSSGKVEGYGLIGTSLSNRDDGKSNNNNNNNDRTANLGPNQKLLNAKREETERERQSLLDGREKGAGGRHRSREERQRALEEMEHSARERDRRFASGGRR